MGYEPSPAEVVITLALGRTVLQPYYARYARGLRLRGHERILDYGSGSGALAIHVANALASGGGRLTCIDVSQTWIGVARRALRHVDNVDYQCGDVRTLDVVNDAYDLILSHFVLHDIPVEERADTVSCLAGKLRPAGRFVLREPCDEAHGISAGELRALLAGAGLVERAMRQRTVLLTQRVSDAEFRRAER